MEDRVSEIVDRREAMTPSLRGPMVWAAVLHIALAGVAVAFAILEPAPTAFEFPSVTVGVVQRVPDPAPPGQASPPPPDEPEPEPDLPEPEIIPQTDPIPDAMPLPTPRPTPTARPTARPTRGPTRRPTARATARATAPAVVPPRPSSTATPGPGPVGPGGDGEDVEPATPGLRLFAGEGDGPAGGAGPSDFKYAAWLARVDQLIAAKWFKPDAPPGVVTRISFRVDRTGRVDQVRLVRSSTSSSFDRAAMRAVMQAQLPTLPPTYPHQSAKFTLDFVN